MKLPTNLKIGHYDLDVVAVEYAVMSRNEVEGRFQGVTSIIEIRSDRPAQNLRDTLLHESLHALLYCTGVNAVLGLDAAGEEQLVCALTSGLLAMLRENPQLVKYLMEGAT